MMKQERSNNSKLHQGGFTLLEIMIALLVLASAATILIGMEVAAIQRTIYDKNVQQSMLAARRIMAALEADQTKLDQGNQENAPLIDMANKLGLPASTDQDELQALSRLSGTLQIEDWPIPAPNMEENPMRKVTLWIAWGNQLDERFQLIHFIPSPEKPPQ